MNPDVLPTTDSDRRLLERLAALERKVAQLERGQTQTVATPDSSRIRVEVGKTASGRWGIRVYDNTGALIHDYTTAA